MAEIPYNLLSKLLIEVRAPEYHETLGADGKVHLSALPTDDFSWCYESTVSTYSFGWKLLEEDGMVERKMAPAETAVSTKEFDPEDGLENLSAPIERLVRFTQKGLDRALEAIESPATRDARLRALALVAEKEALQRNVEKQGFGLF